jgi:hypothetical protein
MYQLLINHQQTVNVSEVFAAQNKKSWISGLLRRVVWWLEINVSESLLHPSSGLMFPIMIIKNVCG